MEIKIDSQELGDIIEKTLNEYRIPDIYYKDFPDINYPLYEKLCLPDDPISKGHERISDIVDAIIVDIVFHLRQQERRKNERT